MDPKWRKQNLVCALAGDEVTLTPKPVPTIRRDLLDLFDKSELKKYLTEEEMAELESTGKASV